MQIVFEVRLCPCNFLKCSENLYLISYLYGPSFPFSRSPIVFWLEFLTGEPALVSCLNSGYRWIVFFDIAKNHHLDVVKMDFFFHICHRVFS